MTRYATFFKLHPIHHEHTNVQILIERCNKSEAQECLYKSELQFTLERPTFILETNRQLSKEEIDNLPYRKVSMRHDQGIGFFSEGRPLRKISTNNRERK